MLKPSAVRPTLEVAGTLVALLSTVGTGFRYLSNYGEHTYSCVGKTLPCLTYSRVEDPGALLGLSVEVLVLGLLSILAMWRVRHPSLWSGIVLATVGGLYCCLTFVAGLYALAFIWLGPPDPLLITTFTGIGVATGAALLTSMRRWSSHRVRTV